MRKYGELVTIRGIKINRDNITRSVKLSASIMCADLLHLADDINVLEEKGFDFLHFDIMDGHFVQEIGFGLFFLEQLTKARAVPVDVHLMVTDPQSYIDPLAQAGAALVSVHYEMEGDVRATLERIRKSGMKAGLAVKPETPLEVIVPCFDFLDLVLLMAYPPGIRNQNANPQFGRKIREASELLEKRSGLDIDVAVDGGVTLELMGTYRQAGANFFILGSSGLFLPEVGLAQQIGRIKAKLAVK